MTTELDAAALEAIKEHFREITFDICAAGEEILPQLMAIRTDAEGRMTGWAALPQFGLLFTEGRRGAAMFSRCLPLLVRADSPLHRYIAEAIGFDPVVFVQINEAWMAPATEEEMNDPNRTPPSERADRREAILIALHTHARTYPWGYEIVAEPTRHAVMPPMLEPGPWIVGGRMTMQESAGTEGTTH